MKLTFYFNFYILECCTKIKETAGVKSYDIQENPHNGAPVLQLNTVSHSVEIIKIKEVHFFYQNVIHLRR